MKLEELEVAIKRVYLSVFESRAVNQKCPDLIGSTVLLSSGLDSLGFALLVVELEDELGYDPFTESEESFYPRTFGEFVDFYYRNFRK